MRYPVACLLATVSALPVAHADEPARRKVIEQKSALVQRVLDGSALANRVAAGSSEEARAQLARAAEQHRRALALAQEGRLQASEAAMDEAMASIGRARRLAPDRAQLSAELRVRYEALLESTQALHDAARRQGAKPLEPGEERLARARQLAASERLDEALAVLLEAERATLDILARTLGTTTLDYTVRFDSPGEELRHESERFGSFQRLVPIALEQFKPGPTVVQLVEQYAGRASELRERAGAYAARGDIAAALASIRDATRWLQRALAAAGVVVPAQ